MQAYHDGFYGPNIIWVMLNWMDADWTDRSESVTSCTRAQLLEVLQDCFFTGPTFVNPIKERGIAGINTEEFDEIFLEHFNYSWPFGSTYRMPAYDSVWAVALALNATLTKLIEMGGVSLRFTVSYAFVALDLMQAIGANFCFRIAKETGRLHLLRH